MIQGYSKSLNKMLEGKIRIARDGSKKELFENGMKVEIYGPEFGWIDLKLSCDDQKTLLIEISDVYNPFPEIKIFLEQMAMMQNEPVQVLFDSERYYTYFRCEPIPNTDLSRFIACTTLQDDPVISIVCSPKSIALKIYNALINFTSEDHVNGPDNNCWWDTNNSGCDDYDNRAEEWEKNEEENYPRWVNHDIVQNMIRSSLLENLQL